MVVLLNIYLLHDLMNW